MTELRTHQVVIVCGTCRKAHMIHVRRSDWEEWTTRINRRFVQEVFPYLSAAERELIMSNTCGQCFDAIFADPEESL